MFCTLILCEKFQTNCQQLVIEEPSIIHCMPTMLDTKKKKKFVNGNAYLQEYLGLPPTYGICQCCVRNCRLLHVRRGNNIILGQRTVNINLKIPNKYFARKMYRLEKFTRYFEHSIFLFCNFFMQCLL